MLCGCHVRPLLLRGLRNIQALSETRLLRPFRRVTHRVLDSQRSCSSSVEENPMWVRVLERSFSFFRCYFDLGMWVIDFLAVIVWYCDYCWKLTLGLLWLMMFLYLMERRIFNLWMIIETWRCCRIVDLFTEGLDYTLFEAERVDFDEIIGLSPYKIACAWRYILIEWAFPVEQY